MKTLLPLLGLLLLAVGCERGGGKFVYEPEKAVHPEFSGKLALEHIARQVDCGPRPPGSKNIVKARAAIAEALEAEGWEVREQSFDDATPFGKTRFVNLRARYRGEEESADWDAPGLLLLGSHYDTKRYVTFTFVGANDAGSSTGALIEMGRCLALQPALARGVELLFFDGEECFVNYTATDGLYGSRYYVREMRRLPQEQWPKGLVLLDMIGDADLHVKVPTNGSKAIYDKLLLAAQELGTASYFGMNKTPITDDHQPFLGAGVPAIDIIDLDYEPWHTVDDTMDKLSVESLEIVGKTTLLLVEKHLVPDSE
jgi:glutaminyl-peptide cyclotransferase